MAPVEEESYMPDFGLEALGRQISLSFSALTTQDTDQQEAAI